MKSIYTLIIAFLLMGTLMAQTSNINLGCAPLNVQFTAPAGQTTFFWNFDNGSESQQADPSAIFTNPGTYEVMLFTSAGGDLVGTVEITVLEDPILMIAVEDNTDCAPFTVAFTNNSTVPSELTNVTYNWTFGDGNSQTGSNVTHTYTVPGVFDVSLRLASDLTACNQEVLFSDFITVLPELNEPIFTANPQTSCDVPVTVSFNNQTNHQADYSYAWDFGNGQTSTLQNPPTQTYNEAGNYTVTLVLTNTEGCTKESTRFLTFGDGPPVLDVVMPDSICFATPYTFVNNGDPSNYTWTVTGDTIGVYNVASPEVTFVETGFQTITVSAGSAGCSSEITFQVFVYEPDATFVLDPLFTCQAITDISLQANNTSYSTYDWSSNPGNNATSIDTLFADPERDSFYIHVPTPVPYDLTVTDAMGCSATFSDTMILHRPWAHFLINVYTGCTPLTVEFRDSSTSASDLVQWTWIFDDGTMVESPNAYNQSHTYTEPGTYYPRLIVENINGCRDTSDAVPIYVGDIIDDINFELVDTPICIGDSVQLTAITNDDRIDAWHFTTDNGRSFHCDQETELSHLFISETGFFDVTLTVEYNGCYSSFTKQDTIEVLGPLPQIGYMSTCEMPYDLMLVDSSQGATQTTWYIPGLDTLPGGSQTYTFPARGTYQIILEAENSTTGCPAQRDSVEIVISDIMADFPLEERYCPGESLVMDGSGSMGVDNSCFKGYTWTLPGLPRPRTVDDSQLEYIVGGEGQVPFTLVVEDIHGCTDTLTKFADIYNVEPDFSFDMDTVCLPVQVNFIDLSLADTTLTEWEWSFGSTDQNPSNIFIEGMDSIEVTLQVTDVIGCLGISTQFIQLYQPISQITALPGNQICLGDTIAFSATDFTEQGSFLNFDWDFGNSQSSTLQNPSVYYDQPGSYQVFLNIEEDATGCQTTIPLIVDVFAIPEAEFSTSVDGLEVRCAGQVAFTNLSDPMGTNYTWILTDEQGNLVAPPSSEVDPVYFLDKGITTITLIAANPLGCADTIVHDLNLTAPEGNIMVSDSILCLGQPATFTALDMVDVTSYIWDFGDGTTTDNQNPIDHTYSFVPGSGSTTVSLILYTGDEACETIVDTLVLISEVIADFTVSEVDLTDCSVDFLNASTGAASYLWDFDDGTTSTETDPTHLFVLPEMVAADSFLVQLVASDAQNYCTDTAQLLIQIAIDLANIQMPNAFTPGGEAPDDFFNFVLVDGSLPDGIEVAKFDIFNRWGQRVYSNDTPATGWDGQVGGDLAPEAVYAYVIELVLKGGFIYEQKGNVTLLRP